MGTADSIHSLERCLCYRGNSEIREDGILGAPVIHNILWQVDGALFNTRPAITYAISNALNEMGYAIALNVIDGLSRQSLEHCLGTLSQRFRLNPGLLAVKFTKSYQDISPANQPPFPGAREVCKFIHQNDGLNFAIANHSIETTTRLLDAHDFSPLIDDIIGTNQGYPRKPDPSMLLATLEKHNLNPGETLLIGNRDIDIQAGQAAGVRTCLFGQTELNISSDLKINVYGQLMEMLTTQ
jgi:phosphoglycolate phosphatase-like HAD superfamily hydrolase